MHEDILLMTRLKSVPLAIGAIAVSAGAVLAFSALPDAAATGLANAASHSGQTVPARPAEPGAPANTVTTTTPTTVTPDAPTDNHGAVVSAVAKAADTTPSTNHGADVSAVAKQNHGQTVAGTHRPADAGKPVTPGAPVKP
jgi:hypothetical protein